MINRLSIPWLNDWRSHLNLQVSLTVYHVTSSGQVDAIFHPADVSTRTCVRLARQVLGLTFSKGHGWRRRNLPDGLAPWKIQNTEYKHLLFTTLCRDSVTQRQSVGLGVERSRVRNLLEPSGFSPRQGNQSALLSGPVRWECSMFWAY